MNELASRRLPFVQVMLVALAAFMLIVMLVPASYWRSPSVDDSILGFDSNTMYADPQGLGTTAGAITMDPEALRMVSGPGSAPVVHLLTGPLSYSAFFKLTISSATVGSTPIELDIAAPYRDYHYKIVFTAQPASQVLIQKVHQGIVLSQELLGLYAIGQQYDVHVDLDRVSKVASFQLTTPTDEIIAGNSLLVSSTDVPFESHIITGDSVDVVGGAEYSLSTALKLLSAGSAGLSIEWLDAAGARLDQNSKWQSSQQPSGWSGRTLTARAPEDAKSARVEIATAQGAQALFAQVSLSATGNTRNLLTNSRFENNASGWRRLEGTAPLVTQSLGERRFSSSLTVADWPELFASLRMSLSVRSQATDGLASAELTAFKVDLKHQRWLAVQVDDGRLTLIICVLFVAALALITWTGWKRRSELARFAARLKGGRQIQVALRPLVKSSLMACVFVLGYALISRVGSLNADVIGARIWIYTAGNDGPASLYFSPNISSAEAAQWQGLPLEEAGMPYGPVMAYIIWGMGLIYRWIFHQPVVGSPGDLVQIDVILKSTIALFTIVDAWLGWRILANRGVNRKLGLICIGGLIFNPAVWFAGAVWGTTQSISLLFLLLAIMFADRNSLAPAWTFLLAAVLTRPQSIFVVMVLAVVLIRTSPPKVSLRAVSWAVVWTFVYIFPLSLMISPTLPADILINAFFLHVGDGNDAWTLPVSFGAMSIWPLVTLFIPGTAGVDRVLYPATATVNGISFYQIGTILLAISVLSMVLLALVRGRWLVRNGRVPLMLAATSLGTFIFNTGTPTYHVVLAVVLIVLTGSALPPRTYWFCTIAVSFTTFFGMSTMGAYWLSGHPTWGVGLYDPSSPLVKIAIALVQSDIVLTLVCVLNVIVYAILVINVFKKPKKPFESKASRRPMGGDTSAVQLDVGIHDVGSVPLAGTHESASR